MKVTQDLIVFDLEATASINREGYQENRNIIQVGAVYLKRIDSAGYQIIDNFDRLVKPKDEIISDFITELTGISNTDVENADTFDVVGEQFKDWAQKHGNLKRIKLCAWGTHFDIPLLRSNYEMWRMDYPFVGGGYDIKSWSVLWSMVNGHTEKMGLKEASEAIGLKFEGKLHNALSDAEHTAKIALRILEELDQRLKSVS